jgi:hypothetical protein
MRSALIFSALTVMTTLPTAQTLIPAADPSILYQGRIDRSAADKITFDWPGITIQTIFTGTTCSAVFEGVNCFDAFIDGVLAVTFQTKAAKQSIDIAKRLSDRSHRLLIVKRSESAGAATSFYGLVLDDGKTLVAPPPLPARKIEFIGDSYTVGFANEYMGRECPSGKEDSILLAATNTNKAFGPAVARAFGAQYHITAVSGKGLVRNYNGIDKGRELPACYERTLVSTVNNPAASEKWDFSSWRPDVVVIGIGINDFQANPPYPDSAAFDAAYHAFVGKLRQRYPGVKIVCCATKVWPTDALIPRVKAIVAQQLKMGNHDIRYFEYMTENGALYGHPHIHDHQAIANELIPVVAELSGWRRTDMDRGK